MNILKWISVEDRMPDPGQKVIARVLSEMRNDKMELIDERDDFCVKFCCIKDKDTRIFYNEKSVNDLPDESLYFPEKMFFNLCGHLITESITHWIDFPHFPEDIKKAGEE